MEKYAISMRKVFVIAISSVALGLACILTVWSAEDRGLSGVGRAAGEDQIRAWSIDVSSTGEGLPPGRGTVKQGAQVFAAKCAVCHGPTGTEGPKDKLVGGRGTLTSPKPVKTIGSYWPYAPTVYDYINRAMPFNAPGSLTPEEIYSVVAWLFYKNEIVPEDAVIDAKTLPQVVMPNRDGFIPDGRPDVRPE
jgi:S-disulfanyl-L-cysteine oxidoreductase SoxD